MDANSDAIMKGGKRSYVLTFFLVLLLCCAQPSNTHTRNRECHICHAPVLRRLRGGGNQLAPEAIADGDGAAGGLRGSTILSRSADLASWISTRGTSEASRRGQPEARGEHATAINLDAAGQVTEGEGAEDERMGRGPRLKCTVVEPSEKHTATIIWLHGRGHEPGDLIQGMLPEALALPWCKFVFVHSPKGSGGAAETAGAENEGEEAEREVWRESDRGGRWLPTDESPIAEMDSLLRIVNGLHRIIRQETSGDKGVPSQRLVLAGHGEGGVVAMATALSCRQPLGGLISLSSWFPRVLAGWCDGQTVAGLAVSYAGRRTPALLCHGLGDMTVPPKEGRDLCARLVECGINVEAKDYAVLAHDFCIAELLDVHRSLLRYLPRVERLLSQKRNPHEKEGAAKRRADWGLTKMHPWNSRYLVLRENVLYSYSSHSDYTARAKPLDEWELDTLSHAPSDKKSPRRLFVSLVSV